MIITRDVNAASKTQGCSGTHIKGQQVLECMSFHNLVVLNIGNIRMRWKEA